MWNRNNEMIERYMDWYDHELHIHYFYYYMTLFFSCFTDWAHPDLVTQRVIQGLWVFGNQQENRHDRTTQASIWCTEYIKGNIWQPVHSYHCLFIYIIRHEVSFNMKFYKWSLGHVIKQAFGKLYNISRTSHESLYPFDKEISFYHMSFQPVFVWGNI